MSGLEYFFKGLEGIASTILSGDSKNELSKMYTSYTNYCNSVGIVPLSFDEWKNQNFMRNTLNPEVPGEKNKDAEKSAATGITDNVKPNGTTESSNNGNKEGTIMVKEGGQIHIKKANRGKFTSYCGGKVTNECIARAKASGNKKLIKRAVFAQNARKWKK